MLTYIIVSFEYDYLNFQHYHTHIQLNHRAIWKETYFICSTLYIEHWGVLLSLWCFAGFHIFEISFLVKCALAVLWAFMAIAASQTGDADYSRTPLFSKILWKPYVVFRHSDRTSVIFLFSYIFKVLTQVLLHVCLCCADSEWHRVLPRPLHWSRFKPVHLMHQGQSVAFVLIMWTAETLTPTGHLVSPTSLQEIHEYP